MIKDINIEKRQRILSVAMEEFIEKGYHAASTNNIVKRAGISKGSLFQYFSTKKKLYLYLIEHLSDIIDHHFEENVVKGITWKSRFMCYAQIEWMLIERYPLVSRFSKSVDLDLDIHKDEEIRCFYDKMVEVKISCFFEYIGLNTPQKALLKAHMLYFMLGFKKKYFKDKGIIQDLDTLKEDYMQTLNQHLSLLPD